MANLQLTFNPKKSLKRADLIKLGEMIAEKAKDKSIDTLMIQITDDRLDQPNSILFPFRIEDEKNNAKKQKA